MFNISTMFKLFFLSLLETDKQDKGNFFRLSISLLSTIIILILINFVIYLFYPDNSEALKMAGKELIIKPLHFWIWPEPREQLQIFVSIIIIPLLILSNIKIFSSKFFSRISITNSMHYLNVALWFSFLAIVFYLAFKFIDPNFNVQKTQSLHHELRIFINTMTGELRFFVTLIIFPIITYFIFNGIPKQYNKFLNWSYYLLIIFFLLGIFFLYICNTDNYFGDFVDLNAALYPVSQVQQGKVLLVDFTTQYGLYPHFLYPLFKLINVNVVSFSVTMATLTILSYSLILFALRKIISNNLVVFFSFLAIMYFSFYYLFFNEINAVRYSYHPIRILFPALTLFFVFTYILNPKKILYLFIIFLSSLSILWNFDSGAICFLSFYIYVLYEKLADKNLRKFVAEFIKHTIISSLILTSTFLLFSLVIYLQSNSFPNWNLFLDSTKLFGLMGYLSMPMTIFHTWNLVFLLYLYGIYIGLSSILLNNKNILDSASFFVAIFGIGISSYYLNKSNDFDLLPVLYPCFILLAIYLTKLLDSGKINLFRIKNFLSVSVISFILVTIFVQMMQTTRLINIVFDRSKDIISNNLTNKFINDGIELIKLNSNPGDEVIILIADETDGWIPGPDSILYLETNTSSPLPTPGSQLLFFNSEWDILNQSLANNISHKVFIDFTGQTKFHPLMKIIDDNYYLAQRLGEWRMYVPIILKSTIEPIK